MLESEISVGYTTVLQVKLNLPLRSEPVTAKTPFSDLFALSKLKVIPDPSPRTWGSSCVVLRFRRPVQLNATLGK
jgi:hypothetical protein